MTGRTTSQSASNATEGIALNLKTYQAYTMAEALAAVKRDLGPDAIILNTRSYKRGGVLGLGRRNIVELTASVGARPPAIPPKPIKTRVDPVTPARTAAMKAYAAATVEQEPGAPTGSDLERTRELARVMLAAHEKRVMETKGVAGAMAAVGTNANADAEATPEVVRPVAPVAQRFRLTPVVAEAADSAPQTPVHDELAAIRRMVGEVLERQGAPGANADIIGGGGAVSTPALPEKLFDMYLRMVGQEMSEELARRVVDGVRDELDDTQLDDAAVVRRAVSRRLAELIPTSEGEPMLESPDRRPLTIALVGPTGVGKTTTVAKLAATFKLRQRRRVGLITADTYRIAAVDQLRTYANIIGLPLKVALTPGDMHQAVATFDDCDVILIDTAGRSQNDAGRISELKEFIDAAEPHEVHLVLSGTAGEKVLRREAEAFSAVGVDKIVLTKLDEAVSFGMLVNVVREVGKELSFFTTGQEVPDEIEAGRAERLAELVLGQPVHGQTVPGKPALGKPVHA